MGKKGHALHPGASHGDGQLLDIQAYAKTEIKRHAPLSPEDEFASGGKDSEQAADHVQAVGKGTLEKVLMKERGIPCW